MSNRISGGWSLFKQSWSVLRLDKELMLFPVFSSIACLLVMATFVAPFLVIPHLGEMVEQAFDENQQAPPVNQVIGYVVLFMFYVVNYFVIVFFNTALVSCAVIRFQGGDPSVGDGFRASLKRLPQIFGWAVFSATVGLILQQIESRSQLVGRLVARFIGLAWTITTYFVVPVLAVERLGPIAAVKRSVELLRDAWGEGLVGNFSMSIVSFVFSLPGILIIVAGAIGGIMMQSVWMVAMGVGIGIVYLIGLSIVMSSVKQVFLAGLYLYAVEQKTPPGFDQETFQQAFRVK